MKKTYYLPLACSIIISGCVNREAQKQAKVTQKILSDPVQTVEIYEAKPEKFTENLMVKGTVMSPQDTNISSKIGGRVLRVHVKEGDKVKANQVLAVLESNELQESLRGSEAQVKSAAATLEKAKINAKVSVPKNKAAVESARAQLISAQSLLKKAKFGGRQQEKAQAQAALNAAKSTLEIASKKAERYQKLYEAEAISLQDLETAQNGKHLALSQYEQAKEALSMASGAREEDIKAAEQQVVIAEQNLKSAILVQSLDEVAFQDVNIAAAAYNAAVAQRSLALQAVGNTIIRAPFNGTVSGKVTSSGTVVSPGTPLMRLTLEGNYFIEAELPEKDYRTLKIGSKCQIKVPALSGQTFHGHLAGVNPNLEVVGRLLNVRIDFSDNVYGLLPGMYAECQIGMRAGLEAWFVPSEAILTSYKGNHVFINRNNLAYKKEIQVTKRWNDRSQVSGLGLGDRVIVRGQDKLSAGMKVMEHQ